MEQKKDYKKLQERINNLERRLFVLNMVENYDQRDNETIDKIKKELAELRNEMKGAVGFVVKAQLINPLAFWGDGISYMTPTKKYSKEPVVYFSIHEAIDLCHELMKKEVESGNLWFHYWVEKYES